MTRVFSRPSAEAVRPGRRVPWLRMVAAISASALAAAVLAGPAAATTPPDASANFAFSTLNDQKDPTFNQLLGVNNSDVLAGYYGSGASGHPNRGYTVSPPWTQSKYVAENYPGAQQTQVVGLNNKGITVGFWVNGTGGNFGFYAVRGKYFNVNYPTSSAASPPFDQLLGVNDLGVAVGVYTDSKGASHGYDYNINSKKFGTITVTGDTNVTASGINNQNDVAGFATSTSGHTEAFLKQSDGRVFHLVVPGASATQAFGVNDGDEVVGTYTDGTGASATTHGFTWVPGLGFATVNDPNGKNTTVLNGINDRGNLVGFYTDSRNNVDGLLATPKG